MAKMMLGETDMINHGLMDAVIKLHDVARLVEKTLGQCPLSKSIRQQADRVNELAKVEYGSKNQTVA
jgi:uncharacterized membrane protein